MVELVCPRCRASLSTPEEACRQCGWQERPGTRHLPTSSGDTGIEPKREQPLGTDPAWIHERRWVLLMLFFGLGPLGLPWLWRSRAFSPTQKGLLAAAVLVLTGLVLVLGWWSVEQLRELFRILQAG